MLPYHLCNHALQMVWFQFSKKSVHPTELKIVRYKKSKLCNSVENFLLECMLVFIQEILKYPQTTQENFEEKIAQNEPQACSRCRRQQHIKKNSS